MLPSLDGFHDEVMSWNYFEIQPNVEYYKAQRVQLRYNSIADYASVMDPLLFEEVRAMILRAREEKSVEKNPKSRNHTRIMTVQDAKFTRHASHILLTLQLHGEDKRCNDWIVQGDLVLISKEGPTQQKQTLHALGIVDKDLSHDFDPKDGNQSQWVVRVPGGGTNRGDGVYASVEDGREKLGYASVPGTKWLVTKMCSLVTAQREYQALRSVEHLPKQLLHTILQSNPAQMHYRPLSLPPDLEEELQAMYNPSQWRALRAALRGAITLVQGPPGTGKTKTILGLLSVLLNSRDAKLKGPPKQLREAVLASPNENEQLAANCTTALNPYLKNSRIKLGLEIPALLMKGDKEEDRTLRENEATWRMSKPWERLPKEKRDAEDGVLDMRERQEGVIVKRVLVCAPSNAAIDEIAIRMMETGLPGGSEERQLLLHPKAVRVGPNVHPRLEHISLPRLVEKMLGQGGKPTEESEKTAVGAVVGGQNSYAARDAARKSILEESTVVFCTLSSSGTPLFSQLSIDFDTVIVDEAAQAIELSALIPVKYGCQRLIMVGDVAQLPATVLSQVAIGHGYDISLFHRLQECGFPVWFLQIQYRMHPAISLYPASRFYMNKLVNAKELVEASKKPLREQHSFYGLRCFGPYVFYDMQGSTETESSTTRSWRNIDEAILCVELYSELRKRYPKVEPSAVGIITPYKGQVAELQSRFRKVLSKEEYRKIDINSIDGFQGREKDIVIFSCVRARRKHGVGFLADERRMNVALTRARLALWIIGSAKTLKTNTHWRQLIEDARKRGSYLKITKPVDQKLRSLLEQQTPEEKGHGNNSDALAMYSVVDTTEMGEDGKSLEAGAKQREDPGRIEGKSRTSAPPSKEIVDAGMMPPNDVDLTAANNVSSIVDSGGRKRKSGVQSDPQETSKPNKQSRSAWFEEVHKEEFNVPLVRNPPVALEEKVEELEEEGNEMSDDLD